MADRVGLDWPDYFRSLPEDDARVLATWLGAQGLQLGEFMEVVDSAFAAWPRPWSGQPDAFIDLVGTQAAARYAFRKRHFARLVAMLEAAMMSGALPGEVAPQELDLPVANQIAPRPVEELLSAVERVSRGRD